MKFYAVGTKREKSSDGSVVIKNVVIDNLPETRVLAVKEAERFANKEDIILEGVYPVSRVNTSKIMTRKDY